MQCFKTDSQRQKLDFEPSWTDSWPLRSVLFNEFKEFYGFNLIASCIFLLYLLSHCFRWLTHQWQPNSPRSRQHMKKLCTQTESDTSQGRVIMTGWLLVSSCIALCVAGGRCVIIALHLSGWQPLPRLPRLWSDLGSASDVPVRQPHEPALCFLCLPKLQRHRAR